MIELKNWSVPFAATTGRTWPVMGQPKIVPYTLSTGKIIGNPATRFHASREDGKRYHAGVDLVCAPGNRVVAMESGRVLGQIPGFVRLGAVVIEHPSCVGVYAEVALDSLARAGLKAGDTVVAGQTIAIGAINYEKHSMLHLEIWDRGHAPKMYTPWWVGRAPPTGLKDPSAYLLALSQGRVASSSSSPVRSFALFGTAIAAAYAFYRWVL